MFIVVIVCRYMKKTSKPRHSLLKKIGKKTRLILAGMTLILCISGYFLIGNFPSGQQSKSVLGTQNVTKKTFTVAVYGDSMVDTMGEQLEYLSQSLKRKYPSKNFQFYNYGIGGQNIEDGLGRFYSPFQYKSRNYPALPDLKPDILLIASFPYNPLNPFDHNKHWLSLIQLVNQAKGVSPRVYLLAEIAPRIHNFGVGPGGPNWPAPQAE